MKDFPAKHERFFTGDGGDSPLRRGAGKVSEKAGRDRLTPSAFRMDGLPR